MKRKIIIALTLLLAFAPISVDAGIMCNDGWESSCEVSHSGCCSHHDGVAKKSTTTTSSSGTKKYEGNRKIFASIIVGGIVVYIYYLVNKK